MYTFMRQIFLIAVTFTLIIGMMIGCSGSDSNGPSLQDVPRYPNAIEGESIDQPGFSGVDGNLVQFTTIDSYDDVLAFYIYALSNEDAEVLSHKSELGRQTAISIMQDNGMISVAIQEFTLEGKVNITLMGVGK